MIKIFIFSIQVDLDDGRASRVTDEGGMIAKEDFIQFAKDTHLLDFETTMGEASPMALLSPRKTKKQPQTPKKGQNRNVEETPDEKVSVENLIKVYRREIPCLVFIII